MVSPVAVGTAAYAAPAYSPLPTSDAHPPYAASSAPRWRAARVNTVPRAQLAVLAARISAPFPLTTFYDLIYDTLAVLSLLSTPEAN
jgi:hypothetical protein